jgi:hypothetical protein
MQSDSVYPDHLAGSEESVHLLYKGMAQVHFADLRRRVQVPPNLFGLRAATGAATWVRVGQSFDWLENLALQPTKSWRFRSGHSGFGPLYSARQRFRCSAPKSFKEIVRNSNGYFQCDPLPLQVGN